MPKVKWKTPEPGQVELEPDGGRPFVGPEVTILAPWVHDLKVGDLISSKTIQCGRIYGSGRNVSPLPFLTPSYGVDEQINPGDVGMFLGTMRTNENNSRGSIPFRMDRYIVLFGAKKYFILNFNYFEPVAEQRRKEIARMLFPFMGDGENTPLWLATVELVIASLVFIAVILLMKTCYT